VVIHASNAASETIRTAGLVFHSPESGEIAFGYRNLK
jgi:hypothetical protein